MFLAQVINDPTCVTGQWSHIDEWTLLRSVLTFPGLGLSFSRHFIVPFSNWHFLFTPSAGRKFSNEKLSVRKAPLPFYFYSLGWGARRREERNEITFSFVLDILKIYSTIFISANTKYIIFPGFGRKIYIYIWENIGKVLFIFEFAKISKSSHLGSQ